MADQKAGAVMDQKDSQALATRERTDIITTPQEYEAAMKKWSAHYHVLSPFTQITGLAVQHGIIASAVVINPDPTKGGPGEVYDGLPFLSKGEVAIAKIGLRKIAEAAGISTTTVRTDPRTILYFWEFKAIATYRGIDGTVVTREATAEWDLRDGSPRMKGWSPAQVSEGRKNGLRNCETRAISAAIREIGIKQKYSQAELRKPFLAIRVAFQPDMSDPATKKLVTERALGSTAALYPSHSLPAAATEIVDAEPVETATDEPRRVGSGAATTSPADETSKPDHDAPPVQGAVRIVEVRPVHGETPAKNGKPARKWTKFLVIDHLGVEHSTFNATIAEGASKCIESKAWVEISEITDNGYTNIEEIAPAGQNPELPGLGNL